jgi:hypothetical protein
VIWKAWIEGHPFDLETLQELFSAGDPLVAQDASDGYYLEWVTLENSDGHIDSIGTQALVKRINGIGRAADSGFQPVSLTGRYAGPDGQVTVVGSAAVTMGRAKIKAVATVLDSNGIPVPAPSLRPKGPRYAKVANEDSDASDALRVLGQSDPLDWYDIYKAWEIVEEAVGGRRQVEQRGWATQSDIDRLTASANHPGISGDQARHARMRGKPGANRSMTMREAEGLVRRIVANWIESHPSY